jgi:hypothetical protein
MIRGSCADAYAADNYGGSVPTVEMGALLALKPDFDLDGLHREAAKIIARALMDYGGYVVDDTAWDVYAFATEWGPDGRVVDEFRQTWGFALEASFKSTCAAVTPKCQWAQDMADIFTHLHVVGNNGPQSIGGGGTARQPLAPPFAEAASP